MELTPIHFYDHPIKPIFDTPPALEKSPNCPYGFIWDDKTYRIIAMLSSWNDFTRRGRMARNMQPAHATAASTRGSLNVGRFYFRVRAELSSSSLSSSSTAGQSGQSEETHIFDIYYDRAIKNVDDRKGQWVIYRELREE